MDPVHIHQRGAVDAQKSCRVQAALKLDDRLIDAMPASIDNGISELVLSYKMSYNFEREKRDALSHARGDTVRIIGPLAA
jgi:hypothetical protein